MKRQWKAGLLLGFAAALSVLFAVLAPSPAATAANPTTMSFQGKVVKADGTNVTDGTYSFVFKLYTAGSGGTALWTETQSTVSVAAGVFQVNLGQFTCLVAGATGCTTGSEIDFNANPNLYLGITFNSDPQGEMTPRVQLQSVPFAFNADRVGGFTAAQLVQLSPGSQQSGFINVSGAGTFGGGLTVNGGAVSVNTSGSANAQLGGSTGTLLLGGASAGNLTLQTAGTLTVTAPNFSVTSAGVVAASSTITGTTLNGTTGINTGAGAGTQRIDASGNVTIGTVSAAGGTFAVNASGDQTAVFTLLDGSTTTNGTSGIGTSTSLVLTSAANFDVGNYVQVSDTNCGGTGVNPCYAKITAKNTNTLTIAPALTWTSGKNVKEYHIPEIGGTDLTKTLANRYGMGYFIGGVATGNGTTYYSEDSITSSLSTFNLLTADINGNTPATINIGGTNTTAINIGVAGTVTTFAGGIATAPGKNVDAGTGALKGGSLTINSGTFAVNSAGAITASTGMANSGGYVQSGGTTNTFTGLVQASSGLTVTGTTTLASLTTAGILHTTAGTGVLTSSAVALGTDTSGNYVAGLGSLTGISASTSSGVGITPNLSVLYGSGPSTAVQGNVQITCASGTGNLNGGGTVITLGSGGVCAAVDTKAAVSFGTSVTTPVITSTAGLGIDAAASNAITIGATNATGVTIGNATSNPTIAFSGSGTFATTSGAVSLNGNTTITGTKTLTVSNGLTALSGGLTVVGATLINNTSASTTTIGSSAAGTVALQSSTGVSLTTGTSSLTVAAAGTTISGSTSINGGNLLVQQAATGAALMLDDSAGKIGSLKAGATKVGFFYDDTGSFSISKDLRSNIASGTGGGNDVLVALANGNVGIGNSNPSALFTVGSTSQFNVTSTGLITTSGGANITGTANFVGNVAISGATAGDALAVSNGTSGGNILILSDGATTVGTVGNGGAVDFQNSVNSANAFQLQNAQGWQVLNVDTTYNGLIANPGFEIDFSGWNNRAGGTIARTTTQNYYGVASGQDTMTATVGAGTYYPVTLAASTQYTLSAYIRSSVAAAAGLITIGFQNTLGTDGTCTTSSFPAVTTTGWTRMTCTFTTAASVPSSDIYVKQTTAVARIVYIDAVRLEAGAVATPYSFSNIALRGTVSNPQNFQNTSNSTTAFQINTAAGTTLFNVDTLNNIVSIGGGVTGTKLALDITGTATAHGVCHVNTGAQENDQVVPCNNNIVGADYAELYPSQTDVEPSDLVTFTNSYAPSKDGSIQSPLLARTQTAYDHNQIGVISEANVKYGDDSVGGSQVIGYNVREEDHPMPLALNGRVMTKVSTENGPIEPGDYITASSVPGIGMKATRAGEVVGRALGSFSDTSGSGKVLVFINPFYYNGHNGEPAVGGDIVGSSLISEGGLTINSGPASDVAIDSGDTSGHVSIGTSKAADVTISHAGAQTHIRGGLTVDESTDFNGPVSMQFAEAQNLRLGKDLAIDNASSDTAVASAITITNSGGAGFTNIINTPYFAVSGLGDVRAHNITTNGTFSLTNATGTAVVTIDNSGAATLNRLNATSAGISGGLTVGGDLDVSGLSTFQKLATFVGKSIFRQDVQFDGHLTIAQDGAGYASLRATETTVHVKFKDAYSNAPVVSATISNGKFAQYTIDHVDTKGFDITLQEPALDATVFSWTAVGVNDPQTATNPLPITP